MSDATETVLRLAGEGGGYEILGRRTPDGGWQFRVNSRDFTPELIGEEPVRRRGAWIPKLDDALGQINQGWPFLYPMIVHPEFRAVVLAEVTRRRLAIGNSSHHERAFEHWTRVCGPERPPSSP